MTSPTLLRPRSPKSGERAGRPPGLRLGLLPGACLFCNADSVLLPLLRIAVKKAAGPSSHACPRTPVLQTLPACRRSILADEVNFNRSHWEGISDEAKDFVKMLVGSFGWLPVGADSRHTQLGSCGGLAEPQAVSVLLCVGAIGARCNAFQECCRPPSCPAAEQGSCQAANRAAGAAAPLAARPGHQRAWAGQAAGHRRGAAHPALLAGGLAGVPGR